MADSNAPEPKIVLCDGSVESRGASFVMGQMSPEGAEALVTVMRRVASRGASASSSAARAEPEIASVPHQPDGRACKLCTEADSSVDPVTKKCRKWYRPVKNARTQGDICWYCGRVWHGTERATHPTLTIYIVAVGQSTGCEMLNEHMRKVHYLVNACVEAGSHDITIQWGMALSSEVSSTQRRRSAVIDDDDEHVELQYYKQHYRNGLGDPLCNGLGHQSRVVRRSVRSFRTRRTAQTHQAQQRGNSRQERCDRRREDAA